MFMNKKPNKTGCIILLVPILLAILYYYQWKLALLLTAAFVVFALYFWWPAFMTLMGQRQYGIGNTDKALKYLKAGHESSRAKTANSVTYGYILLRCGRMEEAKRVLNYALMNKKASEEDKAQLRQIMSLVYYKSGDIREAEELMSEVIKIYRNTSVYGALGYYKILLNSPDAYEFNCEAYDFNSDDKVIIDNMVLLELQRSNLERAEELSEKSIAAGNKGVEIFYHAGQVQNAKGNKTKALEYFEMARSCRRSFMTTVSEEEIDRAIDDLSGEKGE